MSLAPPQCHSLKLDLAVVLDVSIHFAAPYIFYVKDFINKLFHSLDITPNETRVSLVWVDASSAHQFISFSDSYQNIERVEYTLRLLQLTKLHKGKCLNKALEFVKSHVFTSEARDRSDAKKVALFITEGMLPSINGVQVDITGTVKYLKVRRVPQYIALYKSF